MSDRDGLLAAYDAAGGDRRVLDDPSIAHVVADGHAVLSTRTVDGLDVDVKSSFKSIRMQVTLKRGVRIEKPVHVCFGVMHKRAAQRINIRMALEPDSFMQVIAHCIFPKGEKVLHKMNGLVEVGEGAELRYSEVHFHGTGGGVEVVPEARVVVARGGRFSNDFTLTTGDVGRLAIDYTVEAAEDSVTELTARVFGHGSDEIVIRDTVHLNGRNARGLIKTRVAVENEARAEVTGTTSGNAPGARGHMDCMEIVRDAAIARATPVVQVRDPEAKVTHEAAIGSVDRRQMETLMARGLAPEEAVDVIVKGILK